MKKITVFTLLLSLSIIAGRARTLIVYYSYTNNVERIVNELKSQIDADVIEIEPAVKGLDYAANNYAIGSAQIAAIRNNPSSAASYPAIDPVSVNLADYSTVIIGAPLWWSQMAAPLQTFLFQHGGEMAGKNIGLIVSSASSGISAVESDAKPLVPGG
ncbi:MAG: NAD(P)H-dependent oxidoreductase, partial [Muribaculaceae bacterium]|nr:NAD(P)H-dependent oxidoreductase [Muribaculaceae bacterium]